ncbi:hypothetical protein C1H46_018123 [Malus baccata]|uniref:Uncharacterized protein n=1 Tax=Malus baccata TaxID=106549 RepID=A0A540MC93_MALBA|nr:hypothetical protein C1H46_018123 [Malus baccata]
MPMNDQEEDIWLCIHPNEKLGRSVSSWEGASSSNSHEKSRVELRLQCQNSRVDVVIGVVLRVRVLPSVELEGDEVVVGGHVHGGGERCRLEAA